MRIKSITHIKLDSPKPFYDVIEAQPYNNFLIKTNSGYIISHNCAQDEVSFRQTGDIEAQKEQAMQLVSTAAARIQSRFMRDGVNPGCLVLCSSKRTEQSFLESYIATKQKHESKTTIIVDEPQWIIRPDKRSDETFKVAVGNKFLESEVLPLNISDDDLNVYIAKGYSIVNVPIGYYENFLDDINIALTDIAGISTSSITRYFSGARIQAVKNTAVKNWFTKDVIEVGNAPDDKLQYYDFIDMDRIDKNLLSKPMYIHLDMSMTGDKTGIAGVWITGKAPSVDGQPTSRDLRYQLAFVVSVKAPKGHQVSFEKNRQFIRWLRDKLNCRVSGISSDTFQSADLLQQLKAERFNTDVVSVDRLTSTGEDSHTKICLPYQTLRNAIYEERVMIPDGCNLMTQELVDLEKHSDGHIDHSTAGINSKDAADGFCGALFNASQHAEEYSFYFGDDIESFTKVNATNATIDKKQLEVDFTEELNRLFDPISQSQRQLSDSLFNIDTTSGDFYLSQGIVPMF